MTTDSTSKALDAIRAKHHGLDQQPEMLTDEQRAELRAKAEDDAFERMESRADREAETRRLLTVRRALLGGIEQLRHGVVYDANEQADIVEGVVSALGGDVSKDVRSEIAKLVEKAATNVRDGLKGEAVQSVDAIAETIANAPGRVERAAPVDDADDDNDPAKLAALIPRG
jgi:hypothetical protein